MSNLSYQEFCKTMPESIRSDTEKLLEVCKAAGVEVPLADRFYVKNHTPQKSKRNPNPEPTDYVVIPNPRGGRDLWVWKADFPALLQAAIEFGTTSGLVSTEE